MVWNDIKEFVSYLFKSMFNELKELSKDLVSIRPKTMVYLFGMAFLIFWGIGFQKLALFFLISVVAAMLYKEWVAGEWKHLARQREMERLRELARQQSKAYKQTDSNKKE